MKKKLRGKLLSITNLKNSPRAGEAAYSD